MVIYLADSGLLNEATFCLFWLKWAVVVMCLSQVHSKLINICSNQLLTDLQTKTCGPSLLLREQRIGVKATLRSDASWKQIYLLRVGKGSDFLVAQYDYAYENIECRCFLLRPIQIIKYYIDRETWCIKSIFLWRRMHVT